MPENKKPMTEQQERKEAFDRFTNDVRDHKMRILHDEKGYRHIRFSREGSGIYHFDLVTWPGHLAITGDMGSWTFNRVQDMFTFFRKDRDSTGAFFIDPSYWAEKLVATNKQGGPKAFSPDHARAWFENFLDEEFSDGSRDAEDISGDRADAEDDFDRIMDVCNTAQELFARLYEFDAGGVQFGYDDLEGAEFERWSYDYYWCLFAIVWGISQYDEYQTREVENRA